VDMTREETEKALIQQLRSGSEAAFLLVESYNAAMNRVALGFVRILTERCGHNSKKRPEYW